ncbi:hypothetical protein Godav_003896 [Gossypium davidsonii]|uniref:Uncharacterized protein n=1 Tax=Gossypium davidsonii TaxID=34287 RepID=A0A7J8SKX7_GOSDV|nr:hypothetical protein [Gossypium davidsonii]
MIGEERRGAAVKEARKRKKGQP